MGTFSYFLEFRLLSTARAERVDDLVDRLAEESRDLLHVFSCGLQLRGLLFFLHGQACGLAECDWLTVSGLLGLLWRV